jgi:hypothetical protein
MLYGPGVAPAAWSVAVTSPNAAAGCFLALPLLLAVAGCESLGRGVASAVLEQAGGEAADTRLCSGEGLPVPGIEPLLARQDALPPIGEGVSDRPEVKVIYVHGIGTHAPGHGTELANNLARSLALDVRAPRTKRIVLTATRLPGAQLGEVNLIRMTDQSRRRDLVFYELTWSAINALDKEAIAFDKSDVYRTRRAGVNQVLREFVNDVAPDPLAYAGANNDLILSSVGQALCWGLSRSWGELPELTEGVACGPDLPGLGARAALDSFVFITHSLGSRATIDSLQRTADVLPKLDPAYAPVAAAIRDWDLQVFMLSNQLPLLQAGAPPQRITGEVAQFCGPGAPRADARFVKVLRAVAFSDPNDLMSYPVPEAWAERYLDSRLCTEVTNIDINIAQVRSLPVIGTAANPLEAHLGYAADERVGGILAKGIGHPGVAPIVAERCAWRETDEALMR